MSTTRYKSYVDNIARQIHSGELSPGTRLPTHRAFAKQQGVSLVTVSRIYRALINLGLVSGETGRGTFVRDISLLPTSSIEHDIVPNMLDLNYIYPITSNQTQLLRDALRRLSTSGDLESFLHYLPHAGRRHERTIIAKYLAKRGLKSVDPDNIALVSGAQHGLATVVLGIFNPGDVIAVDSLTYPGFKALAKIYHIDLVTIPVTETGPDLFAFAKLCQQRNIRGYYTMPTLHNPLGWVMDLATRNTIIQLAKEYNFYLIEDGSFAYLQNLAPPPLAQLAPDITFYISGFSKNIATGLRVGMVVAPAKYIADIERIIRITTWNTPAITTAIVCEWLESGEVEKLERDKRLDAKERQKIVRQVFDKINYAAHESSYFVWIPLPEDIRAEALISRLENMNIVVSSAASYAGGQSFPHAIRVAVSSLSHQQLKVALQQIQAEILYMVDL